MTSYPERLTPGDGGRPSGASPYPAAGGLPGGGVAPMQPRRDGDGSLAHVVETLLDKGLVLNADIMVSVAGVELLGIRLRAALASFETAARYGLEFPSGTDTETAAWRQTREEKETCPACGKRAPVEQLLNEWCPWCGWRSAQARMAGDTGRAPEALTAGEDRPAAVHGDGAAEAGTPSSAEPEREPERRDG
ncbi:gas vesicle protein [Streptomyces sp. NPDC014344]|uniref:gas vesicle protein n=1 Tax=Streptomyces sp. NPDC014344 TaxID=3364871 RepID=UPI003702F44E